MRNRVLVEEVNQLTVQLRHEIEKKVHLEQALTALVLTTGINSQHGVTNTGIPSLLIATKATTSSMVSYMYYNIPHLFNKLVFLYGCACTLIGN